MFGVKNECYGKRAASVQACIHTRYRSWCSFHTRTRLRGWIYFVKLADTKDKHQTTSAFAIASRCTNHALLLKQTVCKMENVVLRPDAGYTHSNNYTYPNKFWLHAWIEFNGTSQMLDLPQRLQNLMIDNAVSSCICTYELNFQTFI